ncbi:MAG: diacylglycerol/lipid kinase family protein [Thermoleophilia bacterium]
MPESMPFIFNPAAGPRGRKRAEKAMRTLAGLGVEVKPFETPGPGSATAIARSLAAEAWPRLLVAGGDGTINEAVNGIAGSSTGLAVIPAGTANVLARELGIPDDIAAACRAAVGDRCVRIDLGNAGGRYFTLMAGAGFDAMVIKNINPVLKKTIRHAAFPVAGIRTYLGGELPLLRVAAGDVTAEGYFVVAANSRYYGGRFGPTPAASMTDGLLDVCVLKEKSLTRMVEFWYKALKTERLDSSLADYFRAADLEITCPDGGTVLLQVDGELAGELPVRVTVEKQALDVCVGAGR